MSPLTFYSLVAVILVAGATLGLWYLMGAEPVPEWILAAYLVAVNIVALAYYGHDKLMAKHRGRRVPELVLHGLAFIGGSLGALAGMRFFHHKTVKGRFRAVFWAILVAQLLVVAEVVRRVAT
jgi:uncharacterized membrane protein YsdA (DUF1294 family)